MLKKSEAFISLLLLPRRWVVLESQADRDKWHGCQFWDLSSYNCAACLHQGPSMQAKFIGQVAWLSILRTMGNEGFAMAAKKICKPWIPYKMTIKINQVIPYKMKGPNPAMVSNCISRFLYDSDSILKSSTIWQGAGRLPTKWPLKWASRPFKLVHKMTPKFGFKGASRPPI